MVENTVNVMKKIGQRSAQGVFVYDLAGDRMAYMNAGMERMLGFDEHTGEGRTHVELRQRIRDNDVYLADFYRTLITASSVTDVELRLRGGKDKFLLADCYLFEDDQIISGFVKDVTLEKEHTNYITEFGARKDAILDMVAHNLSGPLNITHNVLNLIDQQNHTEHYRKIDRHTRLIRENTYQCIEIINSFLKEEHLESMRIQMKATRFDVVSRINVVIAKIRAFQRNRTIQLSSSLKELYVLNDDVKFFQVVHNLLSNALKFSPADSTVLVEVREDSKTFSISVTDNGIGIPAHLQPYIFLKNTPASRDGLHGEKSIGMGLYIIKKLVGLMGGEVAFESEENKGSKFMVTLPITV